MKVKLAAFPFQKYGMAEGRGEHVSADAQDSNTQEASVAAVDQGRKTQPMAYKTLVALKTMHLEFDGRSLPLSAGMRTSVEILLGDQTVMEYLISPVKKAFHEAARER